MQSHGIFEHNHMSRPNFQQGAEEKVFNFTLGGSQQHSLVRSSERRRPRSAFTCSDAFSDFYLA